MWFSGKESACNAGSTGSIPGQEDPLEKEMATHSSIFAWEILWTEEPGRLQFVGSQVRQDLATKPLPLAQKQKHRSMEQDQKSRNKPTHLWSINL